MATELPRGPVLYDAGLMIAYRTTPIDGTPAELWELKEPYRNQPDLVAMFVDMGKLPQVLPLAMFGRVERASDRELVIRSAPWITVADTITASIRSGLLATSFVATFVRDVAAGLAAAGDIVFRSLSPTSLAVTIDGAPRLLDLAIAKWRGRSVPDTGRHIIKGKIPFMSVQGLRSEPIDVRHDVFALGLVAMEMLTGTRVFRGSDVDALRQIQSGRLPEMPSLRDHQPAALLRILDGMVAHDVANRLTPADVVTRLELETTLALWSPEQMFQELRRAAPDAARTAIELAY